MIKSCTEDLVCDIYMHWFKNWKNIIFHHSLVSYDFKEDNNIIQKNFSFPIHSMKNDYKSLL